MAFDVREFRLQLLQSLIEGASENYKEDIRINNVIDDKAQKIAGIGGVFLAAALAFVKADTLSAWPFNRLRVLIPLLVAVVLIICCIGFCLRVLWIRAFPGPPTVSFLKQLKSDLFAIPPADLNLYEESYWEERGREWETIVDDLDSMIVAKARWLFAAQLGLALAMFTIALLLILIIQPFICSHWGAICK
jgi:multisubunit Na+/H+ antiporter MnhB subunit